MDVARRGLGAAVLQELRVLAGESHGVAGFRLADLPGLPDAVLGALVPVRSGLPVHVADGFVWADAPAGPERLFPAEQANLDAFNLFDGRHPLAAVARIVADVHGLPDAAASELVRRLFLGLVAAEVVTPANAPAAP